MRVRLSSRALEDLRSITRFISRDSKAEAQRFSSELRRHCLGIGGRSRLYPLAEDFETAGVRRCLYRSYLIFYRVGDSGIEVLHICHGSRDWKAALTNNP